ncbi:hypothetical protein ACPXCS_06585 [Streptomyces sp. DT190]|uniref:hypothetical protein n=1 Tax=unclassified Streptomyces TaxID=2593676 RepID=UPI003CEDB219
MRLPVGGGAGGGEAGVQGRGTRSAGARAPDGAPARTPALAALPQRRALTYG